MYYVGDDISSRFMYTQYSKIRAKLALLKVLVLYAPCFVLIKCLLKDIAVFSGNM